VPPEAKWYQHFVHHWCQEKDGTISAPFLGQVDQEIVKSVSVDTRALYQLPIRAPPLPGQTWSITLGTSVHISSFCRFIRSPTLMMN
jgi:hypothetical protein